MLSIKNDERLTGISLLAKTNISKLICSSNCFDSDFMNEEMNQCVSELAQVQQGGGRGQKETLSLLKKTCQTLELGKRATGLL